MKNLLVYNILIIIFMILIILLLFATLHYTIKKLIFEIKYFNILKEKVLSNFLINSLIKVYKILEKGENSIWIFLIYSAIPSIIWFIPLKYNENALLGFTGLVAILEGTLSDKKIFKKKATLNILNITILYIIIALIGDYIEYEPLKKCEFNKNFLYSYDFIFSLIRAYLLAILYIKAFKIVIFYIKDKENKNI